MQIRRREGEKFGEARKNVTKRNFSGPEKSTLEKFSGGPSLSVANDNSWGLSSRTAP